MEKENRKAAYINACQKRSTPKEILKQVQDDMVRHDADARMRRIVQGMTGSAGRSMVEMLGVLAIVGVLSAGALKGYSDAMFKHKMNQTIDIVTHMFQRVDELYQKGLGEADIQHYDATQWGLLEKCDLENGGCRLPIGSVEFELLDGAGAFWFHFSDAKSCTAFASVHWEQMLPVEWWYPNGYVASLKGYDGIRTMYSPVDTTKNTLPTTSEYAAACQEVCTAGDCGIYIQIYDW